LLLKWVLLLQKAKHVNFISYNKNIALYCYACDDDTLDPNLSVHLSTFGIDVKKQVKTEKSMAEMELALNLAYSLSQQYEQGLKFTPVYGPCLTGIENIGNTYFFIN